MGAQHTPRPVTAIIKGDGLNSAGGGFTRIVINGERHHPDDVAAAVEHHAELLAALERALAYVEAEAGKAPTTDARVKRMLQARKDRDFARAAIAKARGQA